jgi:hypothetical protein
MVGIRCAALVLAGSSGFLVSAAETERLGDAWTDPRNPVVVAFKGERLNLWSLKPLQPGAPPAVADDQEVQTEIDRFVRSRMAGSGQSLFPPADRRALVRRLYFDLTGLPPDPAEVEAAVADRSPEALIRVVDRLLASPRFGEHWARMWLDVVRYSDSNGFDWDEFRPQAWRFRDYVVRAYASDMPFDRFLTEQLAGDELLVGPPRTEAERDALIATGYLRIGPQDNSAKLFNEEDRARHELLSDLTETTASAFLALTLACCRCHDHKTEPLTQADHYRFRAFFETVAAGDEVALDLAADQEKIRAAQAEVDAVIQPLERSRTALLASGRQRLVDGGKEKPSDDEARAALSEEEKRQDDQWKREIDEARSHQPEFTKGLLMTDAPDAREQPVQSRILAGGDHQKPGESVSAGYPSILDPNPAALVAPANPRTSGRRLSLARWLADPENPLTARVYVNRVWQALFGQGLVATPNDFGFSGEPPADLALLDWLAARFMADGWSTKRLVRMIVLSGAYQQSVIGPMGLAGPMRPSLRRLSAEQLRDAQLAVAGLLLPTSGGPPVWPELPHEVLTANPAFLDDNETKTKGWYPSPREQRNARSVFLVQKRTVRVPVMETFDQPENATSCGRRSVSTVAPQALALLNGALTEEVAGGLAARIVEAAGEDHAAQAAEGFRLALQRAPNPQEHLMAIAYLDSHSLVEFARVLVNLNEFVYLD